MKSKSSFSIHNIAMVMKLMPQNNIAFVALFPVFIREAGVLHEDNIFSWSKPGDIFAIVNRINQVAEGLGTKHKLSLVLPCPEFNFSCHKFRCEPKATKGNWTSTEELYNLSFVPFGLGYCPLRL
jgi:hypothetical protein